MKSISLCLLFLGLQGLTISGKVMVSDSTMTLAVYSCILSKEPLYVLTPYSECKDFYVCSHKRSPEYFMCPDGTLFNTATQRCDENTQCKLPPMSQPSEILRLTPEPSINHPSSEDYDSDPLSTQLFEKKTLSDSILDESSPVDETKNNLSDTQEIFPTHEAYPSIFDVILERARIERIKEKMSSRGAYYGSETSTTQVHQTSYETVHGSQSYTLRSSSETKMHTRPSTDIAEPTSPTKKSLSEDQEHESTHSTVQGQLTTHETLQDGEVPTPDSLPYRSKDKILAKPSEDISDYTSNNKPRNEGIKNLNTHSTRNETAKHIVVNAEKIIKSVKKRHNDESDPEYSIETDSWLDDFLVSVVRDVLNDDDVMVKVTNLISTVFDIVTPLAKELSKLSNQSRYPTAIGVRRETVDHTLEELQKEACPIFKDILIQKLPAVLFNLSESVPELLKFTEQVQYRIEANKLEIVNEGLSLLKKYESVYETSTPEYIFIYPLEEIQEDIEYVYEIFSEIFNQNLSQTYNLLMEQVGLR